MFQCTVCHIFLGQNGAEIMGFSTMCQSNGEWHLPLPECHSALASCIISNNEHVNNHDKCFTDKC